MNEPKPEKALGTPFQRRLGLRWTLLASPENAVTVEMEMRDDLRGPAGSLEGGVISTLADVAGASSVARAVGALVATQQLSVVFLSPGRVGPIHATAFPLRVGHSDATAEVRIHDVGNAGRLIAVATMVLKVLSSRR